MFYVEVTIRSAQGAVRPWRSIDAIDALCAFPQAGIARGAAAMSEEYTTATRGEIEKCLNCPYDKCRNCFEQARMKKVRGKRYVTLTEAPASA